MQFQKGLSLFDFQRLYGTEELCVAALEQARWPTGFCCPRCASHDYGIVSGRRLKRFQCRSCHHQNHGHCRHHPVGHQATSDGLVPGLLSDRPGQNRHLLPRVEPSFGSELRHRLATAQQDHEGDERARGFLCAGGKDPNG